MSDPRGTQQWKRMCAVVYAEESHCAWCGQYVDQTLPRTHPWSRSVDHIVSLQDAPQLAFVRENLRLMHRRCNSAKENRRRAARRQRVSYSAPALDL